MASSSQVRSLEKRKTHILSVAYALDFSQSGRTLTAIVDTIPSGPQSGTTADETISRWSLTGEGTVTHTTSVSHYTASAGGPLAPDLLYRPEVQLQVPRGTGGRAWHGSPSGRITFGDADCAQGLQLMPGRWRVQVAAEPEDYPEHVSIWITSARTDHPFRPLRNYAAERRYPDERCTRQMRTLSFTAAMHKHTGRATARRQ